MKGLLIKDLYTIIKQMKIFIVMIIVFQLLPGFSLSTFAIVYCAMLPITALAYDERSKWNNLAAMLPYKAKDIVISKYILGYISVAIATTLAIIIKIITNIGNFNSNDGEFITSFLIAMFIATVLQAINLPIMFKFTVEKGRIFFLFLLGLTVAVGTMFQDIFPQIKFYNLDLFNILLFIAVIIVINIISMTVSIKLYKSNLK